MKSTEQTGKKISPELLAMGIALDKKIRAKSPQEKAAMMEALGKMEAKKPANKAK